MKFIVSRNELYKNLSAISGVLSTNNTMPILDNFLFTISGNTLTVTASDLDCTMCAEIELSNVDGEGSIAVPSKNLLDTLKLIPEIPIVFSTIEDGDKVALRYTAAEGKYDDHCFPGDEYPGIKPMEEFQSFEVDASVLHKAISKTLFATGTDELRPNMMGVFCELNADDITFVSTDAHKLVRFRSNSVKTMDPTSFILPKKPLQQLRGIIGGIDEKIKVDYLPDGSRIRFSFNNIVLYSSLKEGKYPNYRNVIPTNNDKSFVVDFGAWLSALDTGTSGSSGGEGGGSGRRVGIYANQSTYQIRISLNDEITTIAAEDVDYSKKAEETIVGIYNGEPMEIGFNSKFLREILENIESNEIQMDLSQPNRAALIYPADQKDTDEENLLMLIMPVMLNS